MAAILAAATTADDVLPSRVRHVELIDMRFSGEQEQQQRTEHGETASPQTIYPHLGAASVAETLQSLRLEASVETEVGPLAKPNELDSTVGVGRYSTIVAPAWMQKPAPRYQTREPMCGSAYRPSLMLKSEAESRRRLLYDVMSSVACEYGLPTNLLDALIIRESGYNVSAFSLKSAFGLTQLMEGTARDLGVNRFNVEGNLRGGALYLRRLLDRFGAVHLALAAYNAGPARVRSNRVPMIPETRDYVDRVLSTWAHLAGLGTTMTLSGNVAKYSQRGGAPFGRLAQVYAF